MTGSLLTTAQVAELLSVSEDYVRTHAADFGGFRLGSSPRGPLRFDRALVMAELERSRLPATTASPRRRPGRPRSQGVELLPLPRSAA